MFAESVDQLNAEMKSFWQQQSELANRRLRIDSIRETALEQLRTEQTRGVPVSRQTTLEQALASAEKLELKYAERFRSVALEEQARKGGKAAKSDALNRIISEAVRARPKLSEEELLRYLQQLEGAGVVVEINNEYVSFVNYSDGRTKDASMSGLKHRLSRAKKNNRSR
jgi:hypothetical protein